MINRRGILGGVASLPFFGSRANSQFNVLGASKLQLPDPVTPAPAIAAGLTKLVFFGNFRALSTIDWEKTGKPGFDWYIKNSWPNAFNPTAAWANIVSIADTDTSTISQVSSNLVVSTSPAFTTNIAQMIHTAQADGAGYVGQGFVPPFYVEVKMGFQIKSSTVAWPIAWMTPLEFLTGSASRFTELDLLEFYSGGAMLAIHDWRMTTNPAGDTRISYIAVSPAIADANLHTFGTLWLTMASNSGTGLFGRYVDGVHQADITYTTGQAGSFSDNMHHMIMLAAGDSIATTFEYVAVWQAP